MKEKEKKSNPEKVRKRKVRRREEKRTKKKQEEDKKEIRYNKMNRIKLDGVAPLITDPPPLKLHR